MEDSPGREQEGVDMRMGNNPLKNAAAPAKMPKAVACVITHLPNRYGYHAKRWAILRACLMSMRKHAGTECGILVWDNGSDQGFKQWLREVYRPDFLIESGNIGKKSAQAAILRMLPEKTFAAVTDDDMLFYPGWLRESIDLLQVHEKIGVVSAWQARFAFEWGMTSALRWADLVGAQVQAGRFLPDEWERDYAVSIGIDPQSWIANTMGKEDVKITWNGVSFYAQAQHCQFTCRAGEIAPYTRFSQEAMGSEWDFDKAIDAGGWVRAALTERLARHMGNVIDNQLEGELRAMALL